MALTYTQYNETIANLMVTSTTNIDKSSVCVMEDDMIRHKALLEKLSYDPDTGVFRWLVRPRQRSCSEIAGTPGSYGYSQIGVNQKIYKSHRLAWFYTYKKWPKQIDHINGNRSDNRIANLREANHSQNLANSKVRVNNRSGLKGASLHKLSGLWMARVTVNYKTILLGYFKTKEEAHTAYCVGARKYHGVFARSR